MENKYAMYVIVIFAVAILGWTFYSAFQANSTAPGSAQYNYYQEKNLQAGSECGDMTDLANVQHLSHHPDRFGNCIKQVDAQIFKQAVGQSKEEYMKQNNIQ